MSETDAEGGYGGGNGVVAMKAKGERAASITSSDLALVEEDPFADWQPIYYDRPAWYRWALLLFLLIACWILGPVFFNWPPWDDLFHWTNAYAHLCHPGSVDYEVRDHGEIYCLDKKIAIEGLSSIGVGIMYAFDLVGGIVLDSLGAKVCCCFGITLNVLGWLLLALSGRGFNGFKAGVFFVAAGCDPYLFGVISSANLFPRWTSTVIAGLGTMRSVAYGNGIILQSIMRANRGSISLRELSFGYLAIVVVLLIVHAVAIPFQPFPKHPPGTDLEFEPGEGKRDFGAVVNRRPRIDFRSFGSAAAKQWRHAKQYVFTFAYLGLIYVGIVQLLRNNYFSATYKYHLPNTTDFFSLASPLSLIPCPFFGMLADRYSTAYVLASIVLTGALGSFFVLFKGKGFEILGIIFNWLCSSFISSEFYCYVAYNYPLSLYGSLAGFVLLVGGLVGLTAANMNDTASRSGNYLPFDIGLVIAAAIGVGVGVYLHFAVEKKNRKLQKMRAAREAKKKEEAEAADDGAVAAGPESGAAGVRPPFAPGAAPPFGPPQAEPFGAPQAEPFGAP